MWCVALMSRSLGPHGLLSPRLLCPWDSPGKNTGVGCHTLPPGMEPTSPTSPALADGFFTSTTLEATYRDARDKISCNVESGKCFPVESLQPVAHFM